MKYQLHLKAIETLDKLWEERSKTFIIHYACESFYDAPMAKTPRITAIAIRSLDSGQTHSFSMHQTAELLQIDASDIVAHYDEIEFYMLNDFAKFLEIHKDYNWIHWNMRDGNYGFQAIKHRYDILKNKFAKDDLCYNMPDINDSNKYDLSLLFIHKYGPGYIGNPRILTLKQLNNLGPKDFMTGAEEAEAFTNGDFHRLLMSTLSKVTLFSHFFQKAIDNELKNNSRPSDVRDNWKIIIKDFITKNPYGIIGFPLFTTIIGYLLGKYC